MYAARRALVQLQKSAGQFDHLPFPRLSPDVLDTARGVRPLICFLDFHDAKLLSARIGTGFGALPSQPTGP
jgi:hypothetical protein